MTQEERLKELLLGVATQLDKWAAESAYGGWSTHQVKPMRKLAGEIRCEVWGHSFFDRLRLRAKPIRGLRRGEIVHTVGDMKVGEVGYVVPWAVDDWDWLSSHLDGLNLGYSVHPAPWGTIDTPICRTETGWVVGGKVFTESKVVKTSRKGVKMAKPKTNLIIEECKSAPNLLKVWVLEPAAAKKSIEAIEGVTYVTHYVKEGYLNAWLNPCYSKAELKAEIEAVVF